MRCLYNRIRRAVLWFRDPLHIDVLHDPNTPFHEGKILWRAVRLEDGLVVERSSSFSDNYFMERIWGNLFFGYSNSAVQSL